MRIFSLRVHTIALVLGAVVPAFAFALAMGAWLASSYRAATEQGLAHTARTLALAIDDEIETWESVLRALATSPALDAGDLAAFYQQAREIAPRHASWIAAKYGALSAPGGRVDVSWRRDGDRLTLRWAERGGPTVAPPTRRGFGSAVIEQLVRHQLSGAVRMDWHEDGLVVEMALPAHVVLRDGGISDRAA